jgi:hypothetical protein
VVHARTFARTGLRATVVTMLTSGRSGNITGVDCMVDGGLIKKA